MIKPTFGALAKPTWDAQKKIWGVRAWGAMVLGQSDQHPLAQK